MYDNDSKTAPTWRTATFAGGASAQQIVRIENAWACTVSPCGDSTDAAVNELLCAAGDAGWSRSTLEEWLKQKVVAMTRARAVVLDELAARRVAKRAA